MRASARAQQTAASRSGTPPCCWEGGDCPSVAGRELDQVVHAGADRERVGATETVDLKRVDKRAELLGGDPADASRGGTRPVDLDGARGGVDREGVVGLAAIDDHAVVDGVAAEIGVDLAKRGAIVVVDSKCVAAAE